jgi:ribonuclease J
MGLPGIGKTGQALSDTIETELNDFLSRIEDRVRRDDDKLDEAIRRIVRQVSMEEIGKKPEVTVVVSRLQAE